MATTLKKTDVVIIGLGAAGGVACLPLAQAGIDVIGLEAGSRLSTKDMAPDELKLNRGLWPPGVQKVRGEGPTSRPNASAQAVRVNHPMMNAAISSMARENANTRCPRFVTPDIWTK